MSYLVIVFIVGLLIAIHEYGHLLAAKLCGIPVARFSVGFGPKLVGFEHKETSYWLSWIPIGGYVLPAIELEEFRNLSATKRIVFSLGGPIANVLAAFAGLFLLGLFERELPLTGATSFAASELWSGVQQQVAAFFTLFANFDKISGIVGIVAVGGAKFGSTLGSLLTFSVLINLSLAVMNMLPLPPLDGGKILFCLLEKIYRPFAKAEIPVTVAGWAMLLMLMVYLTAQDVGRMLA